MKFVLRQAWSRRGVDIWLIDRERVVKPIVFELSDTDATGAWLLPEPTIQLKQSEYESLAASLKSELIANGWQSNADVLEGELKATKFHLEDMRTLALGGSKKCP